MSSPAPPQDPPPDPTAGSNNNPFNQAMELIMNRLTELTTSNAAAQRALVTLTARLDAQERAYSNNEADRRPANIQRESNQTPPLSNQPGEYDSRWLKFSLEKFTGKTDGPKWENFIDDFSTNCIFSGVPLHLRAPLLKHYLADMARTFYTEVMSTDPNCDFSTLCTNMKVKCATINSSESLVAKAAHLKQQVSESVAEFYDRFLKTINYETNGTAAPWIKKTFREALLPDIKFRVTLPLSAPLPELLSTALQAETDTKELQKINAAASSMHMFSTIPPPQSLPKIVCRRCGFIGHKAFACRTNLNKTHHGQPARMTPNFTPRHQHQANKQRYAPPSAYHNYKPPYNNNSQNQQYGRPQDYKPRYAPPSYNSNNQYRGTVNELAASTTPAESLSPPQPLTSNFSNFTFDNAALDVHTADDKTFTFHVPDVQTPSPEQNKPSSRRSASPQTTPINLRLGNITRIFIIFVLFQTMFATGLAQNPMICSTRHVIATYTLPTTPSCIIPNAYPHEPVPAKFQLFKPNFIQFQSAAHHCRVVTTTVMTYENFFSLHRDKRVTYENKEVSIADCEQMIKWHTSPYGTLTNVDDTSVAKTSNVVDFEYHGGFYCCKYYPFTTTNAYVITTTVLKRHGEHENPESPVGSMTHCSYQDGHCLLKDKTMIIWSVDVKEKCQYLPHKTFMGKQQLYTWVADSGELALTFNNPKVLDQTSDCGGQVTISDQGVAIQHIRQQSKREADTIDGTVLDSELNAKLQALEHKLTDNVDHTFRLSFQAICQAMNIHTQLLIRSLTDTPTLAARYLLGHEYIHAKMSGQMLTIFPCQPLPNYYILPSSICTSRIPMTINLGTQNQTMYMATDTNILYHDPRYDDCTLDEEIPILLDNMTYMYHHTSGSITPITTPQPLNIAVLNFTGSLEDLNSTTIHELILYDWHQFRNVYSLNDLAHTNYQQLQVFQHLGITSSTVTDPTKSAQSFSNAIIHRGTFAFLADIADLDIKQLWVFTCCLMVTISIILRTIRSCFHVKYFIREPKARLHRYLWGPGTTDTNQTPASSTNPVTNVSVNVNANTDSPDFKKYIQQLKNLPTATTQPTVTALLDNQTSNTVTSLSPSRHLQWVGDVVANFTCKLHESLLTVLVDGMDIPALLDTGAQLSTITIDIVKALNLTDKIQPSLRCLNSISNHTVQGIGELQHTIRIGGMDMDIPCKMLVINDCKYPMIIGADIMKLIGPFKLDYSSGQMKFIPHCIKYKPRTDKSTQCECQEVTLDRDVLLKPMSDNQLCVKVPKLPSPTVLFEPASVHPSVLLARTLSPNDGMLRLRIVNTSSDHIILYQNTPLGDLQTIDDIRLQDSELNDIFSSSAMTNGKFNLSEKVDLSNSALNEIQRNKFLAFLHTKIDAFARHDYDLGNVSGLCGKVCDTGDHPPIRRQPYRIPVVHREPLDKELQEMLRHGIIEPAPSSAWAAPVLLVKKKNGQWRVVTDYRACNAVTKMITFPLPHQDCVRELLSGQGLFTTIDLQKGYWQLSLDNEEDRERSAFVTYNQVYRMTRLPFGWKTSPQIFQRAMATILQNLQFTSCLAFLDDILIFSPPNDLDHHIYRVGQVLDRFIQYGVKINPTKSAWAQSEVQYLGHLYNKHGSKPAPSLVDKIRKFPRPQNISSLRSALGMFSFYRGYIQNFSAHAKPLLGLLKKDAPFVWSQECEDSFVRLKDFLSTAPILRFPDFDQPFILETDSSGFAMGAQLCQQYEGKMHPLGYFSRTLTDVESRYSTYEREALAIVEACKAFRHFILGHETTVVTDHAPLRWIMSVDHKNSRLAKFSLALQEYNLKVIHKPGKLNQVPDALSRVKIPDPTDTNNVVGATTVHLQHTSQDLQTYHRLQREDPYLSIIIDLITLNKPFESDNLTSTQKNHLNTQKDNYKLVNDILYYSDDDDHRLRLCVPDSLQHDLITTYHSGLFGCHVGRTRTYKRLCSKYFWLSMSASVRDFIAACVLCNQRKRGYVTPVYPLNPIPCERPFDRISMDLLGPLPLTENGFKYLVAFQCSFTKYVVAVPLKNKTASEVAVALIEHVVLPLGIPKVLLSDNGTEFVNELMTKICSDLNIERRTCSPYNPSTDGQIERFFGTYSNLMSTVVNKKQTNWDTLTKYILHAYNNTEHASTSFTPTYLLFGREIEVPFDLCVPISQPFSYNEDKDFHDLLRENLACAWEIARDNIQSAQLSYKYYHDLNTKGHSYQVDDIVYLLIPKVEKGQVRKFTKQYQGPYIIADIRGLNCYLRQLGPQGEPKGVTFVVHMKQLKKATMPFEITTQPSYKPRNTLPLPGDQIKTPDLPDTNIDGPVQSHSYNLRPRTTTPR